MIRLELLFSSRAFVVYNPGATICSTAIWLPWLTSMFLTSDLNLTETNDFGECFACEESNSRECYDIAPLGLQQQKWSET